MITDKSVDTFEQNKCFLLASFCNWKKNIFFVDSQTPLSPFSMLKCTLWTLPCGYNIEKGRGGWNVKIGDWKTHAFNETGFFSGSVSTAFVHDCRLVCTAVVSFLSMPEVNKKHVRHMFFFTQMRNWLINSIVQTSWQNCKDILSVD